MEIIKIKGNHKMNPIMTKLRVAAYVRVSTESDMQTNSFESQQKYFENKIRQNENWTLVDIYSDYGISGSNTNVRTNFMKMINDAFKGKIDLILTKSISRFARNTVDTLKYVRELKLKGIGIYFEEEGIYTLYNSTELLLTVLSSVAQQEIETMSSRIKLGKEMRIQEGIISNSKRTYGYDYDKKSKKYTINKYEARVVKIIFKKFSETKSVIGTTMYLKNKGYKNYNNTSNWDRTSVGKILKSKRYIGILETKKYIKKCLGSKKTKRNNGEENRYIIYNFNPKIVDEDTFNNVQKILESKKRQKKEVIVHNNEMRCGFCGYMISIYNRNTVNESLVCYLSDHKKELYCKESKSMKVSTIKNVLIECLTKFLKEKGKYNNKSYSLLNNSNKREKEIVLRNKGTNIDLFLNRKINRSNFDKNNILFDKKIELINKKINDCKEKTILKENQKKIEIAFYDSIVEKMDITLSLYELLEKLNLILITGGYDENNHQKPFMIRFIFLKTLREIGFREKVIFYKKLTLNNNNTFSYNVLLDYKSKYIKRMMKKTKEETKIINKKIRVRLEIVEEN